MYGSMVLYDEVSPNEEHEERGDGEERYGDVKLRRTVGMDREVKGNLMDTGESIFAQYFSLEVFDQADYVFSNWHCGPGALTFGSNHRRKADCSFSLEEEVAGGGGKKRRVIKVLNYHGAHWHGNGTCLDRCVKRLRLEERRRQRERAKAAAAAAAATDDDDGDTDSSSTSSSSSLSSTASTSSSKSAKSEVRCVWGGASADAAAARLLARAAAAGGAEGGRRDLDVSQREDEDELKVLYARALTAVDPEALCWEYLTVHECDFLHCDTAPDPARWRPAAGVRRQDHPNQTRWALFKSARALLQSVHPVDSVLGLRTKTFTQKELVRRIMESGHCSEGSSFGGMVLVTGGRESMVGDGVLPGSYGFCQQRCSTTPEELGNFTRMQCILQEGGNVEAGERRLKRTADRISTLTRTSFHEKGECLSLDLFRFLVQQRKLTGYRIRHFAFFRSKHYLTPYLDRHLQSRYDLRDVPGTDLMRNLLKLLLNG